MEFPLSYFKADALEMNRLERNPQLSTGQGDEAAHTMGGVMEEPDKCAGILSAALSQHHLSGFEIAQLEFHHLH